MQLHFRPQSIDGRRSAGIHLVRRLVVDRLRRLDLRFRRFDASLVGNRLQVAVADGEHHQVARVFVGVFGGLQALPGGPRIVDRLPVKQGLGHIHARVEIRKRTDRGRESESRNLERQTDFSQD